jgi:hypothetical protein
MSRRLLRSGFADGAVFHAYHAFECLLSAFIALNGYPVPPRGWTSLRLPHGRVVHAYPSPYGIIQEHNTHMARFVLFEELADHAKPLYANYLQLRTFLTYQDRLDSLYYKPSLNQLPEELYLASFAEQLVLVPSRFATNVRIEMA